MKTPRDTRDALVEDSQRRASLRLEVPRRSNADRPGYGRGDVVWSTVEELRWQFLLTILEEAPQVVDALRALPSSKPRELRRWAERYRLDASWLLAVARATREAWARGADGVDWVLPTLEAPRPPVHFPAPLTLAWDPRTRTSDAVLKRIKRYMDACERAVIDAGYRPRPRLTPKAFTWLRSRTVGDPETGCLVAYKVIAIDNGVTESAVKMAVRRLATEIGVPLIAR